jgi:hypothetical protein
MMLSGCFGLVRGVRALERIETAQPAK